MCFPAGFDVERDPALRRSRKGTLIIPRPMKKRGLATVVMIRVCEPWFASDDQFPNTKASCSHHGRSAAAMRSLIESEHGRRWATSLSRTIGER